MAVKKKKKAAAKKSSSKFITVGVLGRPSEMYPLTSDTSAEEVAEKLGITFDKVEVSKTLTGDFKEVGKETKVNGYAAILFTPLVDGGF